MIQPQCGRIPALGFITTARRLAVAFLLLSAAGSTTRAQTQSWNPNGDGTGGNGTWDTGVTADWDSGVVWTDSNDALFSGTGGTITVVDPYANSLTFSATGPYVLDSGTLNLSGSDVTMNSDATISSTIVSGTGLFVTGAGTLTLTGTSTLGSNDLTIDSGNVAITAGGGVSNNNGWIGFDQGTTGSVAVSGSGSSWTNSGNLSVGESGSGSLSITNGASVSAGGSAYIGNQNTATGTVTVSGSGSLWSIGATYVGNSGTGTMVVSNGGRVVSSGNEYIGKSGGGTGFATVTGSGSSWTGGQLFVGDFGTGTLTISNGGTVTDTTRVIIGADFGNGTATVDGTGSSWKISNMLQLSFAGNATLLISNGGSVTAGNTALGIDAGYTTLLTVTGSGSILHAGNQLQIGGGSNGSNTVMVTNGGSVTVSVNAQLRPYGTLALGQNASFATDGNMQDNGGTITMVDGSLHSITISSDLQIQSTSYFNFDVGAGSDEMTFTPTGIPGNSTADINLYGLSGQVTSGTDTVIGSSIGSGSAALGNVYNTGNFTYSVVKTSTSVNVVVAPAVTPLTTAYWQGGQGNVWSLSVGGTASNWTTDSAGTLVSALTPSSTTDVIFSAANAVNQGNTVLGTDMTINSLTVSDTNAVGISGSDSNPLVPNNDTLTITQSNSSGNAITVNSGAGAVTIGANLTLDGNSQTVAVNNAAGLLLTGTLGGSSMTLTGTGTVTLTGPGSFGGGTVDVEFGTLAIQNSLLNGGGEIGYNGGSNGTVTVSGSGASWTNPNGLIVAESGTGTLLISSQGAVSAVSGAIIGDQPGSAGTITMSGSGSLTATAGIIVGNYGNGTLEISGSATVSSPDGGVIASGTGSGGIVTISGSGSTWNANDGLVVGNDGNGTLAISGSNTVSSFDGGVIASGPGSVGIVTLSGTGSAWISNGGLIVAESGSGSLAISNGGAVSDYDGTIIAEEPGSIGTVTVSDSGSSLTDNGGVVVGESGSGSLMITNGGTVSGSSAGYIGYSPGSLGTVTVDGTGSQWTNTGTLYVGESGTGTLAITNGGTVSSTGASYIGDQAGSTGAVTVDGSASTWANGGNNLYIGNSGAGSLTISGGASLSNTTAWIAFAPNSAGSVTVTGAGSSWTLSNPLYIGESGSGTLLISSGGAVSDPSAYLGYAAGATGGATVTGSGSTWTNTGDLYIGVSGTGTLLVSNGGAVSDVNGWIDHAVTAPSVGFVTVTGTGSTWTNSGDLYVGESGSGTLSITDGGLVTTGSGALIGDQAGSTGSATVSTGGSWTNGGDLIVSNSGTGTLSVTTSGSVSDINGWIAKTAATTGSAGVDGTGSTWTNTGKLYVGEAGTGVLTITNGGSVSDAGIGIFPAIFSPYAAYIGDQAGSSGAVTVSGSGSTWTNTGYLSVGESGSGTLLISNGGTVSGASFGVPVPFPPFIFLVAGNGYIGDLAGSHGAVTVTGSGSSWTMNGDLYVSNSGTGILSVTSGGLVSNVNGYIGYSATSSGAAMVSGSGSTWTNSDNLDIGESGTGTLSIAAGGAVTNLNGNIGANAGSVGVVAVTGTGSSWTNNTSLSVGEAGKGVLTISNGGIVTASDSSFVGYAADSHGAVIVSGSGSTLADDGDLDIGESGTGTLLVSNGGTLSNGDSSVGANIGDASGSKGTATVTGSGSTWTASSNLAVGNYGTGTLTISDGGVASNSGIGYVGFGTDSTGTVTVTGSGSTWTNYAALYIGESGTGTLAITDGGVVSVPNSSSVIGDLAGSTGTVTVTGSGSAFGMYGGLTVGNIGTGTLTISDGATVGNGFSGYIGNQTGDSGKVTVTGSGSQWTIGTTLNVGESGTGTLTILNGGDVAVPGGSTNIGDQPGSTGSMTISGSGSRSGDYGGEVVGYSGAGTLLISDGGFLSDGGASYLGYSVGSSGRATVTGSGSQWLTYGLTVGNSGTATLTVENGGLMNNGGNGYIASAPGSTGSATVSGTGSSWVNDGDLFVGYSGTGSLAINGAGSVLDTGNGWIGYSATSSGVVTISGSGSTWTNYYQLFVGESGTGTLTILNGGTENNGNNSWIGDQAGSVGRATVSGSGSQWIDTNGNLTVGNYGMGTLLLSDGGMASDDSGIIAASASSTGIVTVTGSGSQWNTGAYLSIGNSGTGTLTISNGGLVTSSENIGGYYGAYIGYAAGSRGTVNVTGSGSTFAPNANLYVGESSTGTLNITAGGLVNVNGSSIIGDQLGSMGTATVAGSGSQWINTNGNIYVGESGTGMLNVSGGAIVTDTNGSGVIGDLAGSKGTVTLTGSGSQWNNTYVIYIGNSGTGVLTINSQTAVSDLTADIGYSTGGKGTVTVSGGGAAWTNSGVLNVGESGTGTLNITAGALVSAVDDTAIGDQAGSRGTGTVSGSGSTLSAGGNLYVGDSGTGTLLINKAGAVSNGTGWIGYYSGSKGTVTVTGTGSTWTNSSDGLTIGQSGTGTLNISAGAIVTDTNGAGVIGDQAGSKGTVTLTGSGSQWNNTSDLYVTGAGTGTLTINSETSVSDYNGWITNAPSGQGTVTVTGSGATWTNTGFLTVGQSGTGTLTISDGGAVSDIGDYGYIGNNAGATGTVAISGSGSQWTIGQGLYLGDSGTGTLVITAGGALSNTIFATIGQNAGSRGTASVTGTGSTWTDNGDLYVGNSGTGTLLISGGGALSDTGNAYFGNGTGSKGTVTVTGAKSTLSDTNGALYVGNYGAASLLISGGATVTDVQGQIAVNGGSTGSVTVTGSGSQWINTSDDLFVANSGTGSLTISQGAIVSNTNGNCWIGYNSGAAGSVAVTGKGSLLTIGFDTFVGTAGTGTLSITGGGAVDSGDQCFIGYDAGSSGAVTVSGSGSRWTNTGGTDLFVGFSGTGTLTIENGGSVYTVGAYVAFTPDSSGAMTVSGSHATLSDTGGDLYVGESGAGTLSISNGGSVSDNWGYIGDNFGSVGKVTVSGSGSKWTNAGNFYVGESGTGTLVISADGSVSVAGNAAIANYASNSQGTMTVTGSGSKFTTAGSLSVGELGTGTLVINGGGRVVSSGGVTIGDQSGALGMAFVTGTHIAKSAVILPSTWLSGDGFNIGSSGTGTLLISAGGSVASTSNASSTIGYNLGARGTLTITGSGSSFSNPGYIFIGESGSATVLVSSGGRLSDVNGVMDNSQNGGIGGNSVVTVTGSGSTWTNTGAIDVGEAGPATLLVTAGGHVSDVSSSIIGDQNTATGIATVSGLGSRWTNSSDLYIGNSGTGTLTISSGSLVSNVNGWIGNGGGSRGTVTVTGTGSKWTNSGTLTIGNAGAGILALTDGGRASVTGDTTIGAEGTLAFDSTSHLTTAALTIDGGTLRTLSALTFTTSAALDGAGMTVDTDGFNSTFSGDFSGSGGIVKTGSGALTLTGSNTLGGNLLIGAGGSVQISAGGFVSDAISLLGDGAGSISSATVSGAGAQWTTSGDLTAGYSGRGSIAITGGATASTLDTSFLGYNAGSSGSATVSGTGSRWAITGDLFVGESGSATLAITSGGVVSDAKGTLGYNAGSTGSATVSGSGSEWTNTGSLYIGYSGTGTLSISSGGLVSAAGTTFIGSAGTLALDGASTFDTGSLTVSGGAVKTLGALTFAPSATLGAGGVKINTNGFNSTFSGSFSGAGGLAKSGAGTLTLTGSSAYTGATSVTAGTLALTTGVGHVTTLGNTAITVGSGATFAVAAGASPAGTTITAGTTGPGTAGASLTLAPGSAFSMAGSALATFDLLQRNAFTGPAFTIGGASGIAPLLTFDIGNDVSGTDLIHVTKTVDVLATGAKIDIAALAGDSILSPGNYDLITSAGGFSGTGGNGFTLTDTTLDIDGTTYDFTLADSTVNDEILTVTAPATPSRVSMEAADASFAAAPASNTLAPATPLISTAAVPEPGTTASLLTALGLVAASFLRRRRR